ncbi:hypothetical protein D3C81_2093300 [compost metagenome]
MGKSASRQNGLDGQLFDAGEALPCTYYRYMRIHSTDHIHHPPGFGGNARAAFQQILGYLPGHMDSIRRLFRRQEYLSWPECVTAGCRMVYVNAQLP